MADGYQSPVWDANGAQNENDNNMPPPPLPDDAPLPDNNTPPYAIPPPPPDSPPSADGPRLVELQFNGSAGESVTFKLKNNMKLRKAMDAYSARVQRPVDQLRFIFEGERINNDDNPAKFEMVNGDIVEVHMEQIGGGPDTEMLEDWVDIKSDAELLQIVLDEKVRLTATTDRLKKELAALKTNNRALAKSHADSKIHNQGLMAEIQILQKSINGLKAMNKQLGKEKRALKVAVYRKDIAIDDALEEFDRFQLYADD